MKLIAKKPCSFNGQTFYIGDEIPPAFVINPKAQEKLGTIAIVSTGDAPGGDLSNITTEVGQAEFGVPIKQKDGTIASRIRPTLSNGSIVTDPRSATHYVCTEYGMVCLKGKSSWERAEALISIAHPDFREQLIADAEKMHIWRRSNR